MVGNRSLPTEPLPPAPHTSGVVGAHASPSHRPLVFHAGFFFFFLADFTAEGGRA